MNRKSFLKNITFILTLTIVFLIPLTCLSLVDVKASSNNSNLLLRLGHPMPLNNNVTVGYEKFKELVEKKSNGKIKIQIFPNAQMGSDRVTTVHAQRGRELELASSSTSNMVGSHKDYMAFDLPYVISPQSQNKLFNALDNGALGEYYKKTAESIGLVPLMYSQYGFRNFVTTNKEIKTVEDLKGLKVRTANSPVENAVAQAFGMDPHSIDWDAVYGELKQGTINSEGNTFSLLNDAKHTEVIKYATNSAHNYSMHILFINKEKWNSLTSEQRRIIEEAAKEAVVWQRENSIDLEAEAWRIFHTKGIQTTVFNDAELAKLKALTQSVRDTFTQELPAELVKLIADTQK